MARRDISGAVDFAYLENYAAHDQAIIAEVLTIFREQSGMWMRLLDPEAPAGHWRDGAHTMKGAALGVGAVQLGEACAAAEAGAGGSPAQRMALLERVRTALDAALSDIAAYQHEQALQSLRTPRA